MRTLGCCLALLVTTVSFASIGGASDVVAPAPRVTATEIEDDFRVVIGPAVLHVYCQRDDECDDDDTDTVDRCAPSGECSFSPTR